MISLLKTIQYLPPAIRVGHPNSIVSWMCM